ncbi:MAG: hypothetical protein EB824_06245 [Thaumarchaeota archaeon S15]|nr:MAG: hypothetical protein EB824_06245 [Thaumarchaeota archaeon S15]
MEAQEAYRELGLPEGSSQGAIKARYRKLVLELHPDRSRARTEARLRGVTEAYHALRDPSRHAAAAREQRRAQEARNDKRSAPHARGRGMAGGPRGARRRSACARAGVPDCRPAPAPAAPDPARRCPR